MSFINEESNDENLNEQAEACRLLLRTFSACANWPKTRDGMVGLAEQLVASSQRCGISLQAIVDICKESSPLCPTAHDIQRIGSEAKARLDDAKQENQRTRWRKEYGPADPEWSQNLLRMAVQNVGQTPKQQFAFDFAVATRRAMWNTLYYTDGQGASSAEGFWQNAFVFHQTSHPEEFAKVREEWEAAGRTAEPPDLIAPLKPFEKRRNDELWQKLRQKFPDSKRGEWPSWEVLAQAARELGYEDYARAWERR